MNERFYADVITSEVLDSNRPGWFSMFESPERAVNVAFSLNHGVSQPEDWFWALKGGHTRAVSS